VELDLSAPSVLASFKEVAFIYLSRNSAKSSNSMILALIVNLSVVFIEAIIISGDLDSHVFVKVDFARADPFIKVNLNCIVVPLLGASLISVFVQTWLFFKHFL